MRPRYFYSRASARRDCAGTGWDKIRCISTHAPLRGATRSKISHYRDWSISTHAPLRGATFLPAMRLFIRSNFYSRASARRDWRFVWLFLSCCISTHAPLRGATNSHRNLINFKNDFYSRASARRDNIHEALLEFYKHFYSRASARRDIL